MELIHKVLRMQSVSADLRRQGRSIALVPTMGGLHAGHLSLVRMARERGAEVVVSIFVNPKQFSEGEDLASYPRDITSDCELLTKEGVAHVFAPEKDEVYPPGFATSVDVPPLSSVLSGQTRPGHFAGVATVVLKLFNIVRPNFAVFGWKDAQQLLIIQRLVEDLNLPVEILAAPTVRDSDGVAASTRNAYLDEDGRRAARTIYRSLQEATKLVEDGERSPQRVEEIVRSVLEEQELISVDYVKAVSARDLSELRRLTGLVLLLVSVKVAVEGKPPALLIDNVRIEVEEEKS